MSISGLSSVRDLPYAPRVLDWYDPFVHGFSNHFAWRCPTARISSLYRAHVSSRHLDVGVGTGYFLDNAGIDERIDHLSLIDLNPECLSRTAERLRRFRPTRLHQDVRAPFQLGGSSFTSVSMTYLLHCVPGDMADKGIVFRNVSEVMRPGATLFGATILGHGAPKSAIGRLLMSTYLRLGIFSNASDDEASLRAAVEQGGFSQIDVWTEGCVGLFVAVK